MGLVTDNERYWDATQTNIGQEIRNFTVDIAIRCVLLMCSGFLPTLKAITKPTIPTQNMIRNGKNLKMEKMIKQNPQNQTLNIVERI
jgi:hypothetical protein